MTLLCENKYELTTLEVDMANQEVKRQGSLLNMSADYWAQFIKKNDVDEKALVAAGYDGDGQVAWIREQMQERGWLGGEAVQAATPVDEALRKANLDLVARKAAARAGKEEEAGAVEEADAGEGEVAKSKGGARKK